MPMYDFHCEQCDMKFETIEPVGAEVASCPSCGEDAPKQLSNFGGFEFQGSDQLIDPGVESVDHWIGKDSEKRAKVVEERQHKKRQLKFKKGGDKTLTRDAYGNYDVVEEDKEEKIRELHEFEHEVATADEDQLEEVDDAEQWPPS